jgi:hypothetical protein
MSDLIITNGDTAAGLLVAGGRSDRVMPWQDVLHEGPIIATGLDACTRARIDYLARRFRIGVAEVAAQFEGRDAVMRDHARFDRIELWFEHDLFDQLQLVQILAFFAAERRTDGLVLVQADDFLGSQTPQTILGFASSARAVERADLDLAASVWSELAAPTPIAVALHAAGDDRRLPFLNSALGRFLEELPAPGTGLGRTEQGIIAGIAAGTRRPVHLFQAMIASEEAPFMGDASFFRILDDLASSEIPLIAGLAPPGAPEEEAERIDDANLELTVAGEDVLSGAEDHVVLSGIDRWWAGTRLNGRSVWRYERSTRQLVPPASAEA